ncbi:MAG: hypothetical protein EB015_22940, partial [Methylocystaceae bacterium]|nr:hypothetical protein [Methylocystaceae bacterium]
NADQPFDRFSLEQLAGDLLPNATEAQRVLAHTLLSHPVARIAAFALCEFPELLTVGEWCRSKDKTSNLEMAYSWVWEILENQENRISAEYRANHALPIEVNVDAQMAGNRYAVSAYDLTSPYNILHRTYKQRYVKDIAYQCIDINAVEGLKAVCAVQEDHSSDLNRVFEYLHIPNIPVSTEPSPHSSSCIDAACEAAIGSLSPIDLRKIAISLFSPVMSEGGASSKPELSAKRGDEYCLLDCLLEQNMQYAEANDTESMWKLDVLLHIAFHALNENLVVLYSNGFPLELFENISLKFSFYASPRSSLTSNRLNAQLTVPCPPLAGCLIQEMAGPAAQVRRNPFDRNELWL